MHNWYKPKNDSQKQKPRLHKRTGFSIMNL